MVDNCDAVVHTVLFTQLQGKFRYENQCFYVASHVLLLYIISAHTNKVYSATRLIIAPWLIELTVKIKVHSFSPALLCLAQ